MIMRVTKRSLMLCLLAAGTLASCGGGDDFSGDPKVPDGYKTFETTGISFAYPGDWQVAERTDPVEHLDPAWLQAQRAGGGGGAVGTVEHLDGRAGRGERAGQREAGGAGADHEYRCLHGFPLC